MKLTNAQVRALKPQDKAYKIADGAGLYLNVAKTGTKSWRFKYVFNNKEQTLTIGLYPEITLKRAREKHFEAKQMLQEGINPSQHKQKMKKLQDDAGKNSFDYIAMEWFEKEKDNWSSSHRNRIESLLVKDICPFIGKQALDNLSAPDILGTLRKIEKRGAIETAHRAKYIIGQVSRYGIATGRCERDYTPDLKGALKRPVEKHLASITDPKRVADLLNAIDEYEGTPFVRNALMLAPLVFVRPGELRQAEWTEINFEKARWEIPAEKMKMRQPHIVPLSDQALAILNEQHERTSHRQYVFPGFVSPRKPMSDNTMRSALRRMGFGNTEMSVHGFRAMARTLLDEELNYRIEWIEQQLAHSVRDANGRAYNRTTYLKQRTEMMQGWADYLDQLKTEAVKQLAS